MFNSKEKFIKIVISIMITSLLSFSAAMPVKAITDIAANSKQTETVTEKAAPALTDEEKIEEETVTDAVYGSENDDEEKVQIGVYKKLINSYEKLLSIYEKLLNFFGTISEN